MRDENPSLEVENLAMVRGLLDADVPCWRILQGLLDNAAPHILQAALEDVVRDLAAKDPSVSRKFVLMGRGRSEIDPRTGQPLSFDPRKPRRNPDVQGVDGKKRKLNVPKKKQEEIRAQHPEENPLMQRLKF